MYITIELLFQIINTILWILIPIAIYSAVKSYKRKKELTNNKINELENRINELESR